MTETMNRGYKYRAYPDNETKCYLMKYFGARRKVYNLHIDVLYRYIEEDEQEWGR